MNLVLIDGSNIVMRCSFGGKLPVEQSVATATGMIDRCCRQLRATHCIIALDVPAPTWRKELYPEYKADRTRDNTPYYQHANGVWGRQGRWVEGVGGFEADDVIATLAARAAKAGHRVMAVSNDSDLLPLLCLGLPIEVIKPGDGGTFCLANMETSLKKYHVRADKLVELKALTGESGDNVPGVPGIGPVRAAKLLEQHQTAEGVIEAGRNSMCKWSALVFEYALQVQLAHQLVSLRYDAPVLKILPSQCVFG